MNKPFSIIIPTYNTEDCIEASLLSIITQQPDLYEAIFVDGQSTDQTVKIIESYMRKYPDNIKLISEPDQGIYDAMNKGIDLAKGEYLYFLGAGDTLRPGILEKLHPQLKNEPELVYGEIYNETEGLVLMGEYDKIRLCFGNICHQSIFYHKRVFEIIGKYNLKYPLFADYEFNIRCFGCSKIKKRFVDIVIANFQGNGLSANRTDQVFLDDKARILKQNFGQEIFDIYQYYNSYNSTQYKFWLNERFIQLFKRRSQTKVGIFGSGSFGRDMFQFVQENNIKSGSNINVDFFLDNDEAKWNKELFGLRILQPEVNILNTVDKIIVASMPGRKKIVEQLLDYGVMRERILSP